MGRRPGCHPNRDDQRRDRLRPAKDREEQKYTSPSAGPVRYEVSDEHSGYVDEAGRFGFSSTEMARQLAPILKWMQEDEQGTA